MNEDSAFWAVGAAVVLVVFVAFAVWALAQMAPIEAPASRIPPSAPTVAVPVPEVDR